MKKLQPVFLIGIALAMQSLVVRHDVDDQRFIDRAKNYPQLCHFPMGEGTLLDSNWILTAGHIGRDLERDMRLGMKPTVQHQSISYSIDQVVVYPGYQNMSEGLLHDIALVKISGAIRGIAHVHLYTSKDESGKAIMIVGSGDVGTGLKGPEKWDKVSRAATNIIDRADEHWIYFNFDAPGSGKETELEGISGPGDSGGPAFIHRNDSLFIVGVSSFQLGQDKYGKGKYGVTECYSRVSSYTEWIRSTMSNAGTTIPKVTQPSITRDLSEYAGEYGFRKILIRESQLFFQRDEEPLISMREIEKDVFLWEDGNTRIHFLRDAANKVTGFEIIRRNGEIVQVARTK